MHPVKDPNAPAALKLRQGVLLSCSLLAKKCDPTARKTRLIEALRAPILPKRRRFGVDPGELICVRSSKDCSFGLGGSSLLDTVLGVPVDGTGAAVPVSEWDLRDVQALLDERRRRAAADALRRMPARRMRSDPPPAAGLLAFRQPGLSIGELLATCSLTGGGVKARGSFKPPLLLDLQASSDSYPPPGVVRIRDDNTPADALSPDRSRLPASSPPPPCGHSVPRPSAADPPPHRRPAKKSLVLRSPSVAVPPPAFRGAPRCAAARIGGEGPPAEACSFVFHVEAKLYLLSGPAAARGPAAGCGLWEVAVGRGGRGRAAPVRVPAAAGGAVAACSGGGRVYFAAAAPRGPLWECDVRLRTARALPGAVFPHATALCLSPAGRSLLVVCGAATPGADGCGCLFEVSLSPGGSPPRLLDVDPGAFAGVACIAVCSGRLYAASQAGALVEYDLEARARRVVFARGFPAVSFVSPPAPGAAAAGRLLALVRGQPGAAAEVWEVDPSGDAAAVVVRRELADPGQLQFVVGGACGRAGVLYVVGGSSQGKRPGSSRDRAVWEVNLQEPNTQQRPEFKRDKLAFSWEEYCAIREAYQRNDLDALSLEAMKAVCAELQIRFRLPAIRAEAWKHVERDCARSSQFDLTTMLKILYSHLPFSEIKHAKLLHDAESQRKETEAACKVKRKKWNDKFAPEQAREVEALFDALSGGHPELTADGIMRALPPSTLLRIEDVQDVVAVVDSNSDGKVSLEDWAAMLAETTLDAQERKSPRLYFQVGRERASLGAKLEKLLQDAQKRASLSQVSRIG
ncbi:hypothetical protein DIPPA_10709 [Diplonema papillatum]|nr:hypothetical protein DIPPA_10709 [Diplonema papillatum]